MRVAFVTNPALGHLLPLLPLALAARDAGHDVALIGGASVAGAVSRVDLRHVVAGPPDLPSVFASVPERAGLTGRRLAAVTWGRAFAGIDLKITPENHVYCFEVNPSPAFSYYESQTGQAISTAVADYLSGN